MSGPAPMERSKVEGLAYDIMDVIREFQMRSAGRMDNKTVLEVLNALGFVAAVVLHGTGQDPNARLFFDRAVDQQLEVMLTERVGFDG